MAKANAPLIMDPSAFIRGATDTPPPVVIGDKTAGLATPAATEKSVAAETASVATAPRKPKKPKEEKDPAPAKQRMPWEDANPKIRNFVQLRLPEPLGLKLRWIKDNSLGVPSVHELILKALEEMTKQRIAEIQKNQQGH